jgi:flagellar motor protein MotB
MRALFFVPLALGLVALSLGCNPVPTPRVVDEADQVAQSPASLDAKVHAAPAWAAAEKRRLEAHAALESGPPARAQLLAEEAIAGFHEAALLARIAKATKRAEQAEAEAAALERDLATVDGTMKTLAADVEGLELRLRVAQGAEPPGASGSASPEREAARRDAARAMAVQARLLCGSARLLGAGKTAAAGAPSDKTPEDPSAPAVVSRDLAEAEARLTELEAALGQAAPKSTPIDLATRTRAACLSVLTRTRRGNTAASEKKGASERGSADSLLTELSAMGQKSQLSPSRDERGVVVTLRDVFDGDKLKAKARTLVEQLDRVAASHPAFAIAVVVHTDRTVPAAERAKLEERAKTIASAFGSVAEAKRLVIVAGDALPVVSGKNTRNARVEIVFVAPEAL